MRADRLLQIVALLRRHGRLPARRLAELLEVSERTILRDMEALSTAGVPVYTDQGRHGGCALAGDNRTEVSGLTTGEAQALFAWTSGSAAGELGLGSDLGRALTKLSATVPAPAMQEADALAAVVVVDRRRWFAATDEVPLLPTLRQAAVAKRRVRLRYDSPRAGQPGTRTVDPYGLVENAGRWYLLAAHRGQSRSYRVSRILAVDVLAEPARLPADLDLNAEWTRMRATFESKAQPVTVRAKVEASALPFFRTVVRGQLATGTELREIEDSGGVVEFTMRAPRAAAAVMLGFGGEIEVLDPPSLRDAVIQRARATLATYAEA